MGRPIRGSQQCGFLPNRRLQYRAVGAPSIRDELRMLLEGEGYTTNCLRLVTDESHRQFRWRNQETYMASSRSKKRSLVERIKSSLRRKSVLDFAFWVLRLLYQVAKLFDLFR